MEDTSNKPDECRTCPYFDRRRVVPNGSREAQVMLVGDYPSLTTPKQGQPFSDRKGIILKTALQHLRNMYIKAKDGHIRWQALKQYSTYMVQCVSDDKPPKAPTTCCHRHLQASLTEIRPKVIVVFGATAFNALGFGRIKFSGVRGTFKDYTITREDVTEHFKVFVTFSLDAVLAQPGIYDDLVRDLRTAFLFAEGKQKAEITEDDLIRNYTIPSTVEEVEAICDHIVNYAHEGCDPDKHLIGGDTETSALEMYDPDAKMIAASFAWEPGYATAILVDHPRAHWTEEELVRVRAAVRRVWECPKPKVLHNEKFDRQVVEGRYGWTLENVVWDTMCGEHLIEEDKKGQYGLKVLTRTRLPKYAGYDDKVDEIRQQHGGLSRAAEAKRYVKAVQEYQEAAEAFEPLQRAYARAMVAYDKAVALWDAKRQEEKARAKAEKRKMDKAAYGKKPPKPRKPKEPQVPEHLPPFDFTLIPIPDLLKYAAVDADVCRQHVLHQNQRLNLEHAQDVAKRAQMNTPAPPPVKRLMSQHVIPTSKTLAQMEFTGFPVDLDYLETLDRDLQKVSEETQRQLYDMAGEFVINNPKEVIAVMFQRGFYEPGADKRIIVPINDDLRRTKKGQLKADEKALLYVHKQYGYEFPKTLLTHRKANKARSPFLVNVREHARLLDGRMHPSFHIPGTSTGRLSSSNENMQNCSSFDTEILTEQGWIRFDQLPRDVRVAQFDTATETISFVEPLEYIQRPCAPGEMRRLVSESVDLCLTNKHEQLILQASGRYARVAVDALQSGSRLIHLNHGMTGRRDYSRTDYLVCEDVDYTGDVYCVRVPTGNIVVRRNGKVVITGNCPKKLAGRNIKNIFVPPSGMTLVNTDAKGAEIRLFAAYSNDAKLIQAILDGLDTHSFFVSQVWKGIKYEDVERARDMVDEWYDNKDKGRPQTFAEDVFKWAEALVRRRTNCKRVVFGTLYGAMAAKIAETAGIPLEEAQEVIDLMFEMFPTIPAYIQSTQNEVLLFGGVYTKTGRKRRFPLANIRMFRNRCFRQAVNFKIQATSSDIVLWVMNQVAPIITKDLGGELHATVHDSIVFSVPTRYLSQVSDMMHEYGTRRVAEKFPWLPIPFEWDVECGPRYGQVININKYLEGQHAKTEKEDGDIIEGDEIREEINAELRI